ncbi:MAG: hypothetical protein K2M36_04275, partial [Clostridia bacterium]|nr:hypothetical protein [Clostridia bacterium]
MAQYTGVKELKAYLNMSIDVSLYGSGAKGQNNTIDLSELLDLIIQLIAPTSGISGSKLMLNITNELGNNNSQFLKLDLDATINLATYVVNLGLRLVKYPVDGSAEKTLLGVYLYGDTVYVDLSGILGDTAKIRLTGLGVNNLLKDTLSKLLDKIGDEEGASAANEALLASKSDIATIEKNMMDWEYIMLFFSPGEVLVQLNADLINAVYKKILQLRGEAQKNLIPDLGDWSLFVGTDPTTDHTKLSVNARFSDALYMTLDLNFPTMTKDIAAGNTKIANNRGTISNYTNIGSINLGDIIDGQELDILDVLNLPKIGLHMGADIQITTRGLTSSSSDYNSSFAGWLGKTLGTLLAGTDILGTYQTISSSMTAENRVSNYGGRLFKWDATNQRYNKVEDANASEATHYFKPADFNLVFGSATESVNLHLDIKANVNLGTLITEGIGAILYSDIAIDVTVGNPVNKQLLSIYYLGSSRIQKNAATGVTTQLTSGSGSSYIYSDAIYIDATGLGLGKIKFQGIAGILGATPSYNPNTNALLTAYDKDAESAAGSDSATTAAQGSASNLYFTIDLENGRVATNFDMGLINTIIDMIGVDLGSITLPDIQGATLTLNFGNKGIDSQQLSSILESVGSANHGAIDPIE